MQTAQSTSDAGNRIVLVVRLIIKSSASSDSKLLQCLDLSCDHKKVTRFLVICGRVKMQLCIRMLLCVFSLAYVHCQHDTTVADVDCL